MQGKKLKLLKTQFGSHYASGDELLFYCPKCKHHKRKLSVNVEADKFKCWVCDYSGRSIRRLIRDFGDYRSLNAWDELTSRVDIKSFDNLFSETEEEKTEQRIELPKEFKTLVGVDLPLHAFAIKKYLSKRKITQEDIIRWKMGYCVSGDYGGRIIIPSFTDKGGLNYFIARSYNGHWKKYMNPPASRDIVFNDLMVDWNTDVVLVEGVFDAIRADANAVPLLGSQLNERSILFQKIIKHNPRVYIALDPDAEKKSAKLIKKMLSYGIDLYKIEITPYTDVGEMPRSEFLARKGAAKPMSSSFGDFFEYLLERTVKI